MTIDSYGQFEQEAEWKKKIAEVMGLMESAISMRPMTLEEIKLMEAKNAPLMVNVHNKPISPVGPDEEIESLGKAYELYRLTRDHKPMSFQTFWEINRVDESRVKSWVRLDKCMSIGRKLRMF
jgi:hypothetical protein